MAVKGSIINTHMPCEINIRLKRKNGNEWILHYSESFDHDLPPEDAELSITTMKKLGVQLRKKGRTFTYDLTGSKERLAAMIGSEFMANSRLGRMTINELFVLVAVGAPNIEKSLKPKGEIHGVGKP